MYWWLLLSSNGCDKTHKISFFVFSTCMSVCLSDKSLGLLKDVNPHEASLRAWHLYIKEFLYLTLHTASWNYSEYRQTVSRQARMSAWFLKFCTEEHNNTLISWRQHTEKLYFVHKVSGKFKDSVLNHLLCDSVDFHAYFLYPSFHETVWSFDLSKSLQLNLTYQNFYIWKGSLDCLRGNMSVLSGPNSEQRYLLHGYCGELPTFSVYPNFSGVDIVLYIFTNTFHHITVVFSVLDFGLITNKRTSEHHEKEISVSSLLIRQKYSLLSYVITTAKSHHLLIHSSLPHCCFYVLDGPGFMSGIVKMSAEGVFELSTFQGIVQILNSAGTSERASDLFNYSFNKLSRRQNYCVANDSSPVLSLSSNSHMSPFVGMLCGVDGFQVNLTVTGWYFTGMESVTCQFGGIVIAEGLADTFNEIVVLCDQNDIYGGLNRSFYSHNSSLLIVGFWYKYYSDIQVELTLSPTKCVGVQISHRTFFSLCEYPIDKLHCQSYLNKITKDSDLFLTYNRKTHKHCQILYSLPADSCFVLQYLRNHSHPNVFMSISGCQVAPGPIPLSGLEIELHLRASLKPFQMYTHRIKKCGNRSYVKSEHFHRDSLELGGFADKVHTTMIGKQVVDCIAARFSSTEVSCSLTQCCGMALSLITIAKFGTPTYYGIFSVSVYLIAQTKSWVDITIFKTTAKRDRNDGMVDSSLHQSENFKLVQFYKVKYRGDSHEQVLLLKYRKELLENSEMKTVFVWLLSQFPKYLRLHTDTSLERTRASQKMVSLPGTITCAEFHSNISDMKVPNYILRGNQNNLSYERAWGGTNITVLWIYGIYSEHSYFHNQFTQKCNGSFDSTVRCLRLYDSVPRSSEKGNRCHKLVRKHSSVSDKATKLPMLSWSEALKMCKNAAAYLPSFTNREELEELVAFLKLSESVQNPPLEAIFIGLNLKHQVGKLSFGSQKTNTATCVPSLAILQGRTFWEDKKLVSFQLFSNINYGQSRITDYYCVEVYRNLCVDLSDTKTAALSTLYPNRSKPCTLLLASNLAQAHWVSVSCRTKMLDLAVCVTSCRNESHHRRTQFNQSEESCSREQILKNDTCFQFLWQFQNNLHNQPNLYGSKVLNIQSTAALILDFQFLFDATSSEFPAFLVADLTSSFMAHRYLCKRYLTLHQCKHDFISLSIAQGFFIFFSRKEVVKPTSNMFICVKGGFVSHLAICDGIIDCPSDDSDEQYCRCDTFKHTNKTQFLCKFAIVDENPVCGFMYYRTWQGYCQKFVLVVANQNTTAQSSFICKHGIEVHPSLKDDIVADCPEAEDEPILVTALKNDHIVSCSRPFQIPCKAGHPKCFQITDICVFQLNEFAHLVPCRNGAHLENCRNFECSTHYKCQHSYCIKLAFVCDSQWDCPVGNDEAHEMCASWSCTNMFRCRQTLGTCIHVSDVCDGQDDCPQNDDESLCALKNVTCPHFCNCLSLAISCVGSHEIDSVFPCISVSLYQIQRFSVQLFNKHFPDAVFVRLLTTGLIGPCGITWPGVVIIIDLSFSQFQHILENCFSSLASLKIIRVDNNQIKQLTDQSFKQLGDLRLLNLSNNPITYFPKHTICASPQLQVLSLMHMSLVDVDISIFQKLTLKFLQAVDHHMCCLAPEGATCSAQIVWYRSCDSLLSDDVGYSVLVVITLAISAANLASIVLNTRRERKHKTFLTNIILLHLTNYLLVLHFSILGAAHISFLETFFAKEEIWRSSLGCCGASFAVFWYSTHSLLQMVYLSLSRLMVVIHPVTSSFKHTKVVRKSQAGMTLLSCFCVLASTVVLRLTQHVLPHKLCSPFLDPTQAVIQIQVQTWFLLTTQSVSLVALVVMSFLLVSKINASAQKVGKSASQRGDTSPFVCAQLTILTVSSFACWFGSTSVFLSVLFVSHYPPQLLLWTVLWVVPLNSLITPIIFLTVLARK